MTKIPKNYILDLTNSRHFTGRSQSSLGSESQSTKNCGTAVAPKDFRIFFTAQLVDLFLDNMSATTFSLVVFRGTWTMCTVVPRNVDMSRTDFTRIEAVVSPFTDMFSQPKKHPMLSVEKTTC